MNASSHWSWAAALGVSSLLAGAIPGLAEPPTERRDPPPSPTVASPLLERLRGAYVATTGIKNPQEARNAIIGGFGEETVRSRDRFMAGLLKWASGLRDGEAASVLVVEVADATSNRPQYRRIVICSASDRAFNELLRLGNPRPTRLAPLAWRVLAPYALRAAEVPVAGEFPRGADVGFQSLLLSYFDGKQWRISEYRDYGASSSFDYTSLSDEKNCRLPALEAVLSRGLDIEFGGVSYFVPGDGYVAWDKAGNSLKRTQGEWTAKAGKKE